MVIDPNTRRPTLLDQILIRSQDGSLHTFLEHDFSQADATIFHNLPPHAIRVIGLNREKVEVLMQMVRDRGITLRDRETVDPPVAILQPEIRTVTEGRIDVRTWRAIAKIAFNYLHIMQVLSTFCQINSILFETSLLVGAQIMRSSSC